MNAKSILVGMTYALVVCGLFFMVAYLASGTIAKYNMESQIWQIRYDKLVVKYDACMSQVAQYQTHYGLMCDKCMKFLNETR